MPRKPLEKMSEGSFLPNTCSKADLAQIFDISTRAVTDWDSRGVLVRARAKGRYMTLPSVHAYIAALRTQASGRASSTGKSLSDERAETEKVQREIAQINLAKLKGEILTLEEITVSWTAFAGLVKQAVLAIPGKARQTIPHLTAHDAEVLRDVCRGLLLDLSEEAEATVIGGDGEEVKDGA